MLTFVAGGGGGGEETGGEYDGTEYDGVERSAGKSDPFVSILPPPKPTPTSLPRPTLVNGGGSYEFRSVERVDILLEPSSEPLPPGFRVDTLPEPPPGLSTLGVRVETFPEGTYPPPPIGL